MRLLLFVAAALCVSSVTAKADVIYAFYSRSGPAMGTSFIIDAPTFLSYSPNEVHVDFNSGLYDYGNNNGPLTNVVFANPESIVGIPQGFSQAFGFRIFYGQDPSSSFNLSAYGDYKDGLGDELEVFSALSGNSVTPEPASFALLGTGLLGVAGIVRKRSA